MPARSDRNEIVLGPARLKVEDQVLQTADQGLIASPTPTTPSEPGFEPIILPGDLVTPPVAPGSAAYPIPQEQPNFLIEDESEWAILDGTAFGWFANSLVSSSGITNLDNTTQSLSYPSLSTGFTASTIGPRVRAGVFWNGAYYWDGSSFVLPASFPSTTLGSLPATIAGTDLNTAFKFTAGGLSWVDETHTYAVGTFNGAAAGRYVFRVANTGGFVVEIVSGILNTTSYTRVQGVENGIAVLTSETGAQVRFVDIVTGAYVTQSLPVALSGTEFSRSAFVLSDGTVAGLYKQSTVGTVVTYGLVLLDQFGATAIQTSYLVVTTSDSFPQTAHFGIPHNDTALVAIQNSSTGYSVIQLTTAGWAAFPLPTNGYALQAQYLRWSPGLEGSTLRWPTTLELWEGSVG